MNISKKITDKLKLLLYTLFYRFAKIHSKTILNTTRSLFNTAKVLNRLNRHQKRTLLTRLLSN